MRDFIETVAITSLIMLAAWAIGHEAMRYLTIAGDWMRSR